MRRTAVAVLIALVCSAVHGNDNLKRSRENAQKYWDFDQVPQQDREPLWNHCAGVATDTKNPNLNWNSCLQGWLDLHKSRGEDDWFQYIEAAPYGQLLVGCDRERFSTPTLYVTFRFRAIEDVSLWEWKVKKPEDRVHLEIAFGRTVSGEHGLTFKNEVIRYDWPSRTWELKQGGTPIISAGIARFYDDEAADILRKIYHSERVTFTDRQTGDTNTVLVTSKAPKVIERLFELCGVTFGEASGAAATSGSP